MNIAALKLLAFALSSAAIMRLTWPSWQSWRAHGFFRLFAFESIVALILVNIDFWCDTPFRPMQIVSWLLLLASLVPAVQGFILLRNVGRPTENAGTETDLGFEKTTTLVTTGVYRYIRHPLYCSLLLLAWGAFIKNVSFASSSLALAASGFLFATAKVEENENCKKFGREYEQYMNRTKMFIPYVF